MIQSKRQSRALTHAHTKTRSRSSPNPQNLCALKQQQRRAYVQSQINEAQIMSHNSIITSGPGKVCPGAASAEYFTKLLSAKRKHLFHTLGPFIARDFPAFFAAIPSLRSTSPSPPAAETA